MVVHMARSRFFRVRLRLLLRPGMDMFRRFLRYGSLVVFNETTWGLGSSIFPTIMGHMAGSTEILAAYTVAGNIDKICMVVSFGLGSTAAIIIGREVGAGRPQQVRQTGAVMCTLALMCGTGDRSAAVPLRPPDRPRLGVSPVQDVGPLGLHCRDDDDGAGRGSPPPGFQQCCHCRGAPGRRRCAYGNHY